MSRRMICALASATVLSAVVPGVAGYISAQVEALHEARQELARLQAKLRMMELSTVRPVAATGCAYGRSTRDRAAASGELPLRPPRDTRPWQDTGRTFAPAIWNTFVMPTAAPTEVPTLLTSPGDRHRATSPGR